MLIDNSSLEEPVGTLDKEVPWSKAKTGAAKARMVPDYYTRLGVDPGADPGEIEAALRNQQPAWSMGTRNPKTRHTNQLYLDEVPALRRVLLSGPEARAAYDAELAGAQIAKRSRSVHDCVRSSFKTKSIPSKKSRTRISSDKT
jgi:hypothetical protein